MSDEFADDIVVRDLTFGDEAPPPDQGDSVFAALAEVHRREGRPDEAEQVARRGLAFEPHRADGRLVLALSLIDQGEPHQIAEAQSLLVTLADRVLEAQGIATSRVGAEAAPRWPRPDDAFEIEADSLDDDFSDHEFDRAFADAETDPDQVIDADHVAQQAMRLVDGGLDQDLLSSPETPFNTRTMAELLERQGDSERASRIRAVLGPDLPDPEPSARRRHRIIMELEGWIENLRRSRS